MAKKTAKAENREISEWFEAINRGAIKLPRFQRSADAWARDKICSLVETVVQGLPSGITLILNVGDNEKFPSRYLKTAPESGRVSEHLLDGQQRLTALWRVFHNNYDDKTFFVYIHRFDDYSKDGEADDRTVWYQSRYCNKKGDKRPQWCNKPSEVFKRGYIPTDILVPGDAQDKIDDWVKEALAPIHPDNKNGGWEWRDYSDKEKEVRAEISDLRETISHYNLPFLSLPPTTEKDVVLDVFINMNTNAKMLSAYDIIVAGAEKKTGESLHDALDSLGKQYPKAEQLSPSLPDLVLHTSALLQEPSQPPNKRGAFKVKTDIMMGQWDTLASSVGRMVQFLQNEGVYDEQRLPTNSVLAVIAALYSEIPESGDKLGTVTPILRRYLWHSFFTDRYENAAATRAHEDYKHIRELIAGDTNAESVPIFPDGRHPLVNADALTSAPWPKSATILGRGILAVASRLGAKDFATGEELSTDNIGNRHYHHIFPKTLFSDAGIRGANVALNCALIADKTNYSIGGKEPLEYMKDRYKKYKWTTESVVNDRLHSHLIPVKELATGGGYGKGGEGAEKLRRDFDAFLTKRAEMIMCIVEILASGKEPSISDALSGL